jgi:transcriptional regulator with XRE-family HTH domain
MSQPTAYNTLGQKIDDIRLRRNNLSLYRIAKDAKVHYTYLYRIMRGITNPSREKLTDVCRAIGCSTEEKIEIFRAAGYYLTPEEAEGLDHVAA